MEVQRLTINRWVFSCLIFIIFQGPTSAQFNFKVAYTGLRANLNQTNQVFQTFDENNAPSKPFGSVHYLQGLDIGGRIRVKGIGIEVGWNNLRSKKIKALGSGLEDNWKISTSEFYAGIENYIGSFGYGVSLGYNRVKYLNGIPGTKDDETILSERLLNARIYAFTYVQSGRTAISIRPYVQPRWGSFSLDPFEDRLNNTQSGFTEYLNGFGFSVILYNGPQNGN